MWIALILLLFHIGYGATSEILLSTGRTYPEVDYFLEELKSQGLKDDLCYTSLIELLQGVKNSTLWATWIWDSMQRPYGTFYGTKNQLGNYDECLNPPWKDTHRHLQTQYCLVDFKLIEEVPVDQSGLFDPYESTYHYIRSKNINGRRFDKMTMGVCIPASCGSQAASALAKLLSGLPLDHQHISVHCEQNNKEYDWKFYGFIALAGVLTLIVVSSTFYLKSKETCDNKSSLDSIAECFCMVKNFNNLTKLNKDEIPVLNGVRFLTALSTIGMHTILFLTITSLNNSLQLDEDIQSRYSFLIHFEVLIDNFFAMSGLLFMKGLLANINSQQNLLVVLIKRYFRLIGPYALTTLYIVTVAELVGDGPLWSRLNSVETAYCRKYWWLNFFMINSDAKTMCHMIMWYVSADYQLAVLATIIFFIYRRDRKSGFITFAVVSILAIMIPGLLTYWNNYPAIPFDKCHDVDISRTKEVLNQIYIKSYCRAGAYLVGMAMAYIMTKYKPKDHRNVISKTWSYIGTAVAAYIMICILNLGSYFAGRDENPIEAAVITALNRPLWAICLCVLIAFSEYGSIPIISKFFSWKVFVPLSKLSYGIYAIHSTFMQKKYFSLRSPFKYAMMDVMLDVFGVAVASTIASLIIWLLVEAPLINLSNHFLSTRSKKHVENGTVQNGHANHNNDGKHKAS